MKKLLCICLTAVLLMCSLVGLTASAATGTLTATASATNVTIGGSVTVTLKYDGANMPIASITAAVNYNASAFEYVSCTGAGANGGAGVVSLSYYATDANAPTSVTVTLTFKAIAAGAGNFSISTSEFTEDTNYTSLGSPSKTVSVSAINPTKSANANLASIKPSSGTLTPAFKPEVTNYTISVPYTTTSLSLSVTTQDKDAKTAVSGKTALAVGKNTQTITVTAPNGATKQYTVVITRSANQTTATTTRPNGTTTTTAPPPQEDPLEVAVDGVLMTVNDTQPNAVLPANFKWTYVTINDVDVSAAYNETTDMTLVYLTNALDNTSAFYIYDKSNEQFYLFCPLNVTGGQFVLLNMPVGQIAPTGTVLGKRTFGSTEREVFLFEDTALEEVCLVYATAPSGKTALYMYDSTDGSMQLYREITVAADVEPTPEPTPQNPFVSFVTTNRAVILICAAAVGGIALLIAAVTLVILITRRNSGCKH